MNKLTAAAPSITATYQSSRFDLPEGREWLVTSCSGHSYVVTIWTDEDFGRMASCRCAAFNFGKVCKHIRFAQLADSILTKSPVREIRPVYEESDECPRCEGSHPAEMPCAAMGAEAEDRLAYPRPA